MHGIKHDPHANAPRLASTRTHSESLYFICYSIFSAVACAISATYMPREIFSLRKWWFATPEAVVTARMAIYHPCQFMTNRRCVSFWQWHKCSTPRRRKNNLFIFLPQRNRIVWKKINVWCRPNSEHTFDGTRLDMFQTSPIFIEKLMSRSCFDFVCGFFCSVVEKLLRKIRFHNTRICRSRHPLPAANRNMKHILWNTTIYMFSFGTFSSFLARCGKVQRAHQVLLFT